MVSKLSKLIQSESGLYFKHFFSVFTAIFLVMTVIILEVMSSGTYTAVDNNLRAAEESISQYVNFHMGRTVSIGFGDGEEELEISVVEEEGASRVKAKSNRPSFKPDSDFGASTEIVLFSADGQILSESSHSSKFYDISLDSSAIDKGIIQKSIQSYWGKSELYRTLTIRVNNLNYPDVAYATILINTDQLEVSSNRTVKIIVSVMVLFWFISLFASIYLAKWTRKPILQSFERQKTFVENASHELRTPLAVLQNRLESLFRHPDETILDNSESIAASLDEVRNMKLLTTNLLNLARRDDGLTPDLVSIEPTFFVDIFDNYELIAEENEKVFKGENLLTTPFQSDKTLLKQLLTILFDNAVKYTGEDGEISLTLRQLDRRLCIQVADNGLGISDQDKSRIFDRFYRVDKARTRQRGGFGLGLSLAQQIVTSLGGTITVRDNSPRGSVFEVRLPS